MTAPKKVSTKEIVRQLGLDKQKDFRPFTKSEIKARETHRDSESDEDKINIPPPPPYKACPISNCRDGLLWNESVWDFGETCKECGGWGFVHDEKFDLNDPRSELERELDWLADDQEQTINSIRPGG